MRCRVLPHATLPGPANMAWDEALLDSAAGDPESAILRTYQWSEPTLSLGYFQAVAEAEADPRWRSAPIVRRPTGGGAIWHDQDLTYALVVPAGHDLARRAVDLYSEVHRAILSALGGLGLAVERRGGVADRDRRRPLLCFLDRDPEDLTSGGSKVVGSAQRRRRGAVLQHGSILLRSSGLIPELRGLGEGLDPRGLGELLSARIPRALGFEPLADSPRPMETTRAEELARSVYPGRAWTRRR